VGIKNSIIRRGCRGGGETALPLFIGELTGELRKKGRKGGSFKVEVTTADTRVCNIRMGRVRACGVRAPKRKKKKFGENRVSAGDRGKHEKGRFSGK